MSNRKFRHGRLICLIVLSLSFLGLSRQHALAADSLGLSLSPPTFEISGNPGDIIKNTLRVENLNDTDITVAIDQRNFTAVGEDGAVGLTDDVTTFSLTTWLTTDVKELTIARHSSKTLGFTISIPPSAEPGGHFGSIIIKTIPATSTGGSGAVLTQELGSLILLKIAGNIQESASVESFSASQNFYEYGPVTFNLRLHNHGSVHLKPTGTVVITDLLGSKVAKLNLDGKNVLPDAIRQMDLAWPVKLALGRYTATLVGSYGNNNQTFTATSTFTIFPYRLILGILAVVIIVTLLLYRSRKRLHLALKVLLSGKT